MADKELHAFVRQFKTVRKIKKLTQQDISDMTGVGIDTIRAVESGRRNPSLDIAVKMAAAVGGDVGLVGF